jgi:hypothetical protein
LTLDSISASVIEFTLEVERLYVALAGSAEMHEQEPNLGGKLLYAGELTPRGRALLVAGNISGAASLAVTADVAAQKQAVRDGVADFLVNSLGEALRILKNEIRKRETVAVCVAAAPRDVEQEMLERGVAPDLLAPLADYAPTTAFLPAPRRIEFDPRPRVVVTYRAASAAAQRLPRLDAIALDCVRGIDTPEAAATRRWLRLAPRYLGRMTQGLRVFSATEAGIVDEFRARVQDAVNRNEIGVEVEVRLCDEEEVRLRHSSPQTEA